MQPLSPFRKFALPMLLITLSWTLTGCDNRPRRVPVSGQVMIDGVPLTKGYVFVIPTGNRPALGTIDGQGRFVLTTFDPGDGCVLGKHRVTVIANEQITPTRMKWLVPKKYIDPELSELLVTIDKPTKDLRIDLTWDGGEPFIEESDTGGDLDPSIMSTSSEPPAGGSATQP
jgi:hypothetical protein